MIHDYDKSRAVCAEFFDERVRQTSTEGWSVDHDDTHAGGHMAEAAAAYAMSAAGSPMTGRNLWPWDAEWWKPKNARRDLVRAGALLVAEIERLDRIRVSAPTGLNDAKG